MDDITDDPQWPREIWCASVGEHEFSGNYVLSEFATAPRWEGDTDRDRDWHRFVDADIYDSADKYWRARIEAQEALLKEAMAWLADFAEAKFDAVQTHRASHPADEPDPVTDAETVWAYQDDARATLAKLRAHLGETK